MLSPYRIPLKNTSKRKQKISNREYDLVTSNHLRRPQLTSKNHLLEQLNLRKTSWKVVEVILNEIFPKINLSMDLALQIVSNDQTVRNNTVQDLKNLYS